MIDMNGNPTKKILLYIYDTMADFEVSLACFYLNMEENYSIIPVGETNIAITAASGLIFKPACSIYDLSSYDDVVGIIFPGGFNISVSAKLQELITLFNNQKKLIGAICAGPTHLALAGILKNRQYTTTRTAEYYQNIPDESDPFPREGFRSDRLVHDDNLITAVGHAFIDFTLEILDFLHLFKDSDERNDFKELFIPK